MATEGVVENEVGRRHGDNDMSGFGVLRTVARYVDLTQVPAVPWAWVDELVYAAIRGCSAKVLQRERRLNIGCPFQRINGTTVRYKLGRNPAGFLRDLSTRFRMKTIAAADGVRGCGQELSVPHLGLKGSWRRCPTGRRQIGSVFVCQSRVYCPPERAKRLRRRGGSVIPKKRAHPGCPGTAEGQNRTTSGDSSGSRSDTQCLDVHISDRWLIQQEVIRDFSPGDVDLDDLAEAVRQLLSRDATTHGDAERGYDRHLLSGRRRGTHVVEGNT
jgi:hypothetical protein